MNAETRQTNFRNFERLARVVSWDAPAPLSAPPPSLIVIVVLCLLLLGAATARAQTFEAFTEPQLTVNVAAATTGRVVDVKVSRGSKVRRGDLLVQLDASILEASRRVAAARAASTAHLDAKRVEFEVARTRYEQLLGLKDVGAGTSEEVQRAKAEADVAELSVRAAADQMATSELELQEIDAHIAQRRVLSPVDGIVIDVSRENGEFVSSSDPQVATIVQLDRLTATFYLPTVIAERMGEGDEVVLRIGERQTTATIKYVSVVTSADSGSVRVDISIDNNDERFRAGVPCWLDIVDGGADAP